MSILALDIGKKRIGVAINPYSNMVMELNTIKYKDFDDLLSEINILIQEYTVETIVLGAARPKTELIEITQNLVEKLPNIKFHFVDEALSTKEAERQLADKGIRNGDTDQRAAKIILEQYLEENKN